MDGMPGMGPITICYSFILFLRLIDQRIFMCTHTLAAEERVRNVYYTFDIRDTRYEAQVR